MRPNITLNHNNNNNNEMKQGKKIIQENNLQIPIICLTLTPNTHKKIIKKKNPKKRKETR